MGFLELKGKIMEIPIIQGGMGIGISLGGLAGAVMNAGGMGTISAANPGFKDPGFFKNPLQANLKALKEEIAKARRIAGGNGILAVNIMVKGSGYASLVKEAVANEVDVIVSGAGLPLDLPKLVQGSEVAIAPIVSSPKAAQLICRAWDRRYGAAPDFIVVEGPEAGGHLGFSLDDLQSGKCPTLQSLVADVIQAVRPFEEKSGRKIPIIAAGGIFTGQDIARYLKTGAAAVQLGTRFIGTNECDGDLAFKTRFLTAGQEDILLVASPAGLPGRALGTTLTTQLKTEGRLPPKRCVNCLDSCSPKQAVYCISEALIHAANGNFQEHALVFTGTNGHRIQAIKSVNETISELMEECFPSTGGMPHVL